MINVLSKIQNFSHYLVISTWQGEQSHYSPSVNGYWQGIIHVAYKRDSKNYKKIAAELQKAEVLSESVTQQVSNDKPTENDKNARIVIGQ